MHLFCDFDVITGGNAKILEGSIKEERATQRQNSRNLQKILSEKSLESVEHVHIGEDVRPGQGTPQRIRINSV